jgi:hypothetical protein
MVRAHQLMTNGQFIAPQNLGSVGLSMLGSNQCLNLIAFGLAEVCMDRFASTAGLPKGLDFNAPQPSDLLDKVSFRP